MNIKLAYHLIGNKNQLVALLFLSILATNLINLWLFLNPPDYSKSFKQFQQQFNSEQKQIQDISKQVNTLKAGLNNLNDKFSKEVAFKEGLKLVLDYEGGLSNDPGDAGGLTNLGITHSEYDSYRAKKNFLSARWL